MTRRRWFAWGLVGATAAAVTACGSGGNVASKIAQPNAMTANEAMDEKKGGGGAAGAGGEGGALSCMKVGSRDTPLIVDMKAMERADLEEAMSRGVGVVAYDCNKIKLLTECKLRGDYAFLATSKKSEAVQFASADEVQANLPFSGTFLVKAGYGRQSSLDLATVMIGKRTTSVRQAAMADAQGTCDGATHFIRGAYVGAFAIKTGTIGKVEASATIFGAGGSAKSDSSKKIDNRDGNPDKCEQVAPDAKAAPAECAALLRLELIALSSEKAASKPSEPPADEPATCPAGTLRGAGGVCTKDASKPHVCLPDDVGDCTAQCEKGNSESCANLGVARLKANQDIPNATKLLEKACAAGVGIGCNGLGVVAAKGMGRAPDFAEAMKQYLHACELGYIRACYNVAWAHAEGQGVAKDKDKAEPIYDRACAGGMGLACMNLGVILMDKKGAGRDTARAAKLFDRACNGGEGQACANLAVAYSNGDGVKKDDAKAKELAERACREGHKPSCGGR